MTLVDTGQIGRKVYSAFSKYTKKPMTEKGFDGFMGTRISENIEEFSKNKKEEVELHKLFVKIHKEQLSSMKVYGSEILRYLKNKKIKIIIISNTSRKIISLVCKHFNLKFDKLVADEDMKMGEEKHQIIKKMMKKLKLGKGEVIYIGDHINDIKEGKKAGIRVISVTTGVYSKKELARYKPHRIINNLNELKKIIA